MFIFSLQTVLEVRERLEKIKYKEFSGVLFEWQNLETKIKSRQKKIEEAKAKLDIVKLEGLSANPLHLYDNFSKRLGSEIVGLEEQQRLQKQALEEKRKELVEARRAHRALEILRDKEMGRYEMEVNRQERSIMDEIASNHHQFQK